MGLAETLRRGLERLAERCPDAPGSSRACDAVFARGKPPSNARRGKKRAADDDDHDAATRWHLKRGVKEDALLAAAGSLLLDPTYAVAAGGCLRPVALHALAHGLDASRARATTTTTKTKNDGGGGSEGGDDDAAATAHERACAALGMLLELMPHARPIAMAYLRVTPPPFARVVRATGAGAGAAASTTMPREHALVVVRGCVRLLRALSDALMESPSTTTRQSADDADGGGDDGGGDANAALRWDCAPLARLLRRDAGWDAEIRWTAAMVLARTLHLPDDVAATLRARQAIDADERHAFTERWEEEETAIALERAGAYLNPGPRPGGGGRMEMDSSFAAFAEAPPTGWDLPAAPGHVRIGGVEIETRDRDRDRDRPGESSGRARGGSARGPPMVRTRGARKNLEAVALALCRGKPLLLEGPAGVGKSATLEEVARLTGNDDFVTLHLDAQTDSKSLLGSYVVGAAPGEFEWRPGALTRAVADGTWVVIEDVDLAPFEVLAALVPLLEERRLYIPGRGESVVAAGGFQLFGTTTTGGGRAGGGAAANARADPLAGLWSRVALEPPRGDEPMEILRGMHPKLTPLAHGMLRTLNVAQRMCGQGGGAAAPGGDAAADEDAMEEDDAATATATARPPSLVQGVDVGNVGDVRAHAGRPFTLRDLLRWARRLERTRQSELSLLREGKSARDALPPKVKLAAYEEAVDVLAGMLPSGPGRRRVIEAIAACWDLDATAAENTDALRKPSLVPGTGSVAVGRAILPAETAACAALGSGQGGGTTGGWARTGHAMRLLERVAAAVAVTEPVLLVGETGTGKTALVQQLARVVGAQLCVVNLSNQSESADFLGGFRPAGARHLCLPLLPRFRVVFEETFPSVANREFMTRVERYAERRKWTHLLHAFRAGVERVAKLASEAEEERVASTAAVIAEAEAEAVIAEADEKTAAAKGPGGRGKSKRNTRGGGGKTSKEAKEPERTTTTTEETTPPPPPPPPGPGKKRRRALSDALVHAWKQFERDLSTAERACGGGGGGPVFAFVEGALVAALRDGAWILLDEINLAPAETLERLGGVLESARGSVVLSERGDGAAVPRHPRFRIFGAMNPATDVGKRDLPAALKHRFTEIYAGECEGREDLALLVSQGVASVPNAPVHAIVDFYLAARADAASVLLDSADQKPQYSLRTLSRALEYVRTAAPLYGVQRALYDGFAMSFQTLLKHDSALVLERLMVQHLLKGTPLKVRASRPSRYRPRVSFLFFFFFSAPARPPVRLFALPPRSTAPALGALYPWARLGPDAVEEPTVGAHTYSRRDVTEK